MPAVATAPTWRSWSSTWQTGTRWAPAHRRGWRGPAARLDARRHVRRLPGLCGGRRRRHSARAFPLDARREAAHDPGHARLSLSPTGYFVWDLRQGALAHATDQDLPPALTYRWTSDGSIVPDAAIVPAGPSADYIGSPTAAPNAATFSRWQPGAIVPIEPLGAHFDQPPTAMTYQSNTAVWSSDGRYLALDLSLRAVLPAASGGPAPSFGDEFCRAPYNRALCAAGPVAYPDAAFAAIRAAAASGAHVRESQGRGNGPTQWANVPVAWRPDGKVVATMLPDQGFATQSDSVKVSLFDTASGASLTALTVERPGGSTNWLQNVDAPVTFWSPDGHQLALLDYGAGRVTIWGPSQLPR